MLEMSKKFQIFFFDRKNIFFFGVEKKIKNTASMQKHLIFRERFMMFSRWFEHSKLFKSRFISKSQNRVRDLSRLGATTLNIRRSIPLAVNDSNPPLNRRRSIPLAVNDSTSDLQKQLIHVTNQRLSVALLVDQIAENSLHIQSCSRASAVPLR